MSEGNGRAHSLRKWFDRAKYFYLIKPLALCANFLTIGLLTRNMGMQAYGLVVLVLSVTGIIMTVLEMRSSEATVKYFMASLKEGDKPRALGYILIGSIMDMVMAMALVLVADLLSNYVARSYLKQGELAKPLFIYLASGGFLFLSGTPVAILQGYQKFLYSNLADLIHKLFRLTWVYFSWHLTVHNVLLGYALSNAFYCALLWLGGLHALRDEGGKLSSSIIELRMIKEFVGFSGATFLSSLLKFGQRDVDKAILGLFVAPSLVGSYDLIKRVAGLLAWVTFPFDAVSYPRLVSLYHGGKYEELKLQVIEGVKLAFLMSVFGGGALYLMSPFMANFFKINPSVFKDWILVILMVNAIVINSLWFVRPLSNAIGRPRYSIFMNAVTAFVLLAALLISIPKFGVEGAVLSYSLSALVALVGWIYIVKNVFEEWKHHA